MPGIRNLLLFLGKKSFRCEQTLLLCDPLVIGKLVKNSQLCWEIKNHAKTITKYIPQPL